jgi:hypothetical protein
MTDLQFHLLFIRIYFELTVGKGVAMVGTMGKVEVLC